MSDGMPGIERNDGANVRTSRRLIRETAELLGRDQGLTPEGVDELDRDLWALLIDHVARVRDAR
jgi:hypothetical protein